MMVDIITQIEQEGSFSRICRTLSRSKRLNTSSPAHLLHGSRRTNGGALEEGDSGELAFEPNALEVSHFSRSTTMLAREPIILLRYRFTCQKIPTLPGLSQDFSPESHELIP
eukprot:scaffold6675_cov110-Cylindrotheca_fusiformis.AAC.2